MTDPTRNRPTREFLRRVDAIVDAYALAGSDEVRAEARRRMDQIDAADARQASAAGGTQNG